MHGSSSLFDRAAPRLPSIIEEADSYMIDGTEPEVGDVASAVGTRPSHTSTAPSTAAAAAGNSAAPGLTCSASTQPYR
eukprot:10317833-Karenia_brevis.AAC.1